MGLPPPTGMARHYKDIALFLIDGQTGAAMPGTEVINDLFGIFIVSSPKKYKNPLYHLQRQYHRNFHEKHNVHLFSV